MNKAKKFEEGLALHIREKFTPLMIEDYGDVLRQTLVVEDTARKYAMGQQATPKQKSVVSGHECHDL